MRSFVLGDEAGLLMATYPRGRRPKRPFPYYAEVMTGFEYAAAVGMFYEGMLDEGLRCIEAIRARYDGRKRSPFDEAECGHHYARAMAAWAALVALSGFYYSAVSRALVLAPRWEAEAFRCLWSVPSGWGEVTQGVSEGMLEVRWLVAEGLLAVERMRYRLPTGRRAGAVTVTVDGRLLPAMVTAVPPDGWLTVVLAERLDLAPGQPLGVRIGLV